MIKSTNVSRTAIFVSAALSLGLAGCATEAERMAKEVLKGIDTTGLKGI
jgi:hypothetical protein